MRINVQSILNKVSLVGTQICFLNTERRDLGTDGEKVF